MQISFSYFFNLLAFYLKEKAINLKAVTFVIEVFLKVPNVFTLFFSRFENDMMEKYVSYIGKMLTLIAC